MEVTRVIDRRGGWTRPRIVFWLAVLVAVVLAWVWVAAGQPSEPKQPSWNPAHSSLVAAMTPNEREVSIPAGQVASIVGWAGVYGEASAAYVWCVGHEDYSAVFGDCYALLSSNAYNAYNVIKWWAYYGDGTLWQWGYALNNYLGYSVI